MDEGKGARKSDFIMKTPTRNEQPSKHEQVLPKKPRSAIKKDLIAFLGVDGGLLHHRLKEVLSRL